MIDVFITISLVYFISDRSLTISLIDFVILYANILIIITILSDLLKDIMCWTFLRKFYLIV